MSVDSVNDSDSIEVDTAAMNESPISSSIHIGLKPSTRHTVTNDVDDDDDDDEFRKMFMSNTTNFQKNHNYSSTPFCTSRKSDKYACLF